MFHNLDQPIHLLSGQTQIKTKKIYIHLRNPLITQWTVPKVKQIHLYCKTYHITRQLSLSYLHNGELVHLLLFLFLFPRHDKRNPPFFFLVLQNYIHVRIVRHYYALKTSQEQCLITFFYNLAELGRHCFTYCSIVIFCAGTNFALWFNTKSFSRIAITDKPYFFSVFGELWFTQWFKYYSLTVFCVSLNFEPL